MVALNKSWPTTHSAATSSLQSRENLPQRNRFAAHRSQSLQRARYYDPSTGEFTSRDQLQYVDGMSLYRGFLQLASLDPFGMAWFRTDVVAKSFINGIPRVGAIDPDRNGLIDMAGLLVLLELWQQFGVQLESNPGDFLNLGLSSELVTATDRLHFLAKVVRRFSAFNEDPESDAKDGFYRLFTRFHVFFECCNGRINFGPHKWDKEGGQELPLVYGSINLRQIRRDYVSDSTAIIEWIGWGKPNPVVEPGMQWVALRTSVNIWHRPIIELSCVGDQGHHRVVDFLGSEFPSRRLWINSVLEKDIDQGAFSDLWDPHSDNPEFVE